MELMRFDPVCCGFPRPGVPLRADRPHWPTPASLLPSRTQPLGGSHFRYYSRGRYALNEAYRLTGLGPGSALLVPAFHCVTMLDPALNRGADILLYRLHADLSPDIAGLDRLLQTLNKPVKALLATHFFGLAQDFSDLRSWCETRGIILIEDCSHVLFTESFQSRGTGIYGRYVTASPYKFFPGEDGGLLYARESRDLADVKTAPPGLICELRGIKNLIEKLTTSGGIPFDRSRLDERLALLIEKPLAKGDEFRSPYTQPSRLFSSKDSASSSLRSSRWLARTAAIEDISRQRRANYQRWLEAVAELPNCRAIYTNLPPGFTPYMFPLRIEHPNPHFYWLKHLGLPIWRWDEMAASDCPIAQDYRMHLLHLPCHQSLSDKQMAWMTYAVQKCMSLSVRGIR